MIMPVDTKTVRFIKVSAKRKLSYPQITKSKSEFNAICAEMLALGDKIKRICHDLGGVTTNALARALATTPPVPPGGLFSIPSPPFSGSPLPTGGTGFGTLGLLGGLSALEEVAKRKSTK